MAAVENIRLFIGRAWVYDHLEAWEHIKSEASHVERHPFCAGFIVTVPRDYGQFTNFMEADAPALILAAIARNEAALEKREISNAS